MYKFVISVIILFLCVQSDAQISVQYNYYSVDKTLMPDSSIKQMLNSYKDSLINTLNKVIGFTVSPMFKKQPEGPLGNLVADAVKEMASIKYSTTIDAAIIHPSSIRSYLPKGEVTIAKVYDIIPGDDKIVIQKITGAVLLQLLDEVAEKAGWPVAGIYMEIKDRKVNSLTINQKPIDVNATYTIAVTDKMINNKEDCMVLRQFSKTNKGYLLRDALIEYITNITSQNKPIEIKTEHRIDYAK